MARSAPKVGSTWRYRAYDRTVVVLAVDVERQRVEVRNTESGLIREASWKTLFADYRPQPE